MNEFLFQSYPGIGTTIELDGEAFDYVSDYHKYWKAHVQDVLGLEVVPSRCIEVAKVLKKIHDIQGDAMFSPSTQDDRIDQGADSGGSLFHREPGFQGEHSRGHVRQGTQESGDCEQEGD